MPALLAAKIKGENTYKTEYAAQCLAHSHLVAFEEHAGKYHHREYTH